MTRVIEVKHVEAKQQVRSLIDGLIDRLEEKLTHFRNDSISVHALFEENGSRTLCRTLVTCHIPGHTVAAHEEGRNAGTSIRKTFSEIERQLSKHSARLRREHLRKRSVRSAGLEA
jgi:ribosomal subunit interface protein